MTELPRNTDDLNAIAVEWLGALSDALSNGDQTKLEFLFQQDSHWRDVLAFTWHLTTVNGASKVAAALCGAQLEIKATRFEIDPDRTPPRLVHRADGLDVPHHPPRIKGLRRKDRLESSQGGELRPGFWRA